MWTEYLLKLFQILHRKGSLQFVCLFHRLSIQTHGYLLYTWAVIQYLFCCPKCPVIRRLLHSFDTLLSLWFLLLFWAHLSFLALQDDPGWSCQFSTPVVESTTSLEFWFLLYELVLETSIWIVRVIFAMGESLLLSPFNWQIKEMCLLTCVCEGESRSVMSDLWDPKDFVAP